SWWISGPWTKKRRAVSRIKRGRRAPDQVRLGKMGRPDVLRRMMRDARPSADLRQSKRGSRYVRTLGALSQSVAVASRRYFSSRLIDAVTALVSSRQV